MSRRRRIPSPSRFWLETPEEKLISMILVTSHMIVPDVDYTVRHVIKELLGNLKPRELQAIEFLYGLFGAEKYDIDATVKLMELKRRDQVRSIANQAIRRLRKPEFQEPFCQKLKGLVIPLERLAEMIEVETSQLSPEC